MFHHKVLVDALIPLSHSILHYDKYLALTVTMPRRTEEETNAAGAEAFRGALVGAAKVEAPRSLHPSAFPHYSHISQIAPQTCIY